MRIDVNSATPTNGEMANPVAAAAQLAPEIVGAWVNFSAITYEHSVLPLRVFEAARARTAEINGCQVCQAFRSARDLPRLYGLQKSVADNGPAPDPAFYAEVSRWRTSDLYNERERLAIEYSEGLGLDPHGLAEDEDFWSRFKAAFTDTEIVDLSFCIGAWQQSRALHALGLDGVCALGPVEELATPSPLQ